jgi:hypothetical protein
MKSKVGRSTRYMQYNWLKIYSFTVYPSIPFKGRYTAFQEYTGIHVFTASQCTGRFVFTGIGALSMSCGLVRTGKMSDVLVNGKCVCITQGTAPHPPDTSTEDGHAVTGRSLAQINSRLFELTGTGYLSHVLNLQVNHFPVQSLEVQQDSLIEGDNALAWFCH